MPDRLGSRWSEPHQPGRSSPHLARHYLVSDGPDRDLHVEPTDWRLKLDPANEGVERGWPERGLPADAVPAEVPGVWNTSYPGYTGVAWYECQFRRPFQPVGAVRLVVGGANYLTDAWLNGIYLGRHEGGYDAFSFRCGNALQPGLNRLTLRIVDPPPDGEIDGLRLRETPTAKESWYGGAGGPWGGVWLGQSAPIWVQEVRTDADLSTGKVTLRVALASDLPVARDVRAIARIHPADHFRRTIAESALELSCQPHGTHLTVTLDVPEPQSWSPESPLMYTATVELQPLQDADAPVDSATAHFGFRTAEFRDGVFHLNGQPRYLKGVLLQPTYPRGLILPPGQLFRNDLDAAKQAGLNLVRVHLRPPPSALLTLADSMGMMLYVEPPLAWIEPSGRLLEHGKREL